MTLHNNAKEEVGLFLRVGLIFCAYIHGHSGSYALEVRYIKLVLCSLNSEKKWYSDDSSVLASCVR